MTSSASTLVNAITAPSAPYVQSSQRNLALAGLSAEASSLLQMHLREHELREGAALWNPGDQVEEVFFPVSGMVSVRVPTKDGHSIEVAAVGREGAAGVHEGSSIVPVLTQAVIQIPGRFIGIPAQAFASAVHQSEEIRRMAEVCNGWLLLQSQQTAACNAVHAADARLCRWLLRASDALAGEAVPATQESIAHALGICRTTATLIAQQLQVGGTITYGRGNIAIRNRAGLQAAACDCYHALGRARWPSELLRVRSAADHGKGHSAVD
jgi:CRP-like cAMP-binding protein